MKLNGMRANFFIGNTRIYDITIITFSAVLRLDDLP